LVTWSIPAVALSLPGVTRLVYVDHPGGSANPTIIGMTSAVSALASGRHSVHDVPPEDASLPSAAIPREHARAIWAGRWMGGV
jgi:hypothetical protein